MGRSGGGGQMLYSTNPRPSQLLLLFFRFSRITYHFDSQES